MLRLLVVQPTPFCNIACDYCYLPARTERGRMALATLKRALQALATSGWLGEQLDVAWHAGEPLVVPIRCYQEAFALFRRHLPGSTRVRHGFQTNATLIDDSWCRFFREEEADVGVSLDGPAWLHDAHRRTRAGAGTHAAAMRGVALLREHQVPFHVICVLTRESLDHADAIIDFCLEHGIDRIGFNVEEAEGGHPSTSLQGSDAEVAYRRFMTRVFDRMSEVPGLLWVREWESVVQALRDPSFGRRHGNDQNQPFHILSLGWQGEVSTFSPELLGLAHPTYGSFSFGNVLTDDLERIGKDTRLVAISAEVARGVRACAERCGYFAVCLGGAPLNKLGELGTMAGTETVHCRLTQQVLIDVVLDQLERSGLSRELDPARDATLGI